MSMAEYLDELKQVAERDPAQAKRDARDALIRTGVMDKDGRMKEQIVDRMR